MTRKPTGRKPGRPRGALPESVIDELGPCPERPLLAMRWWARLLAKIAELRMRGQIGSKLAEQLRADARAAAAVFPLDATAAVEALLRREKDDLDDDAGGGPPTEEADDGAPHALRRDPR